MSTKIYHTVNSGIYFEKDDTGLFFDGIHLGKEYGYSDTDKNVIDACLNPKPPFDKLKALIYTHKHMDHFDKKTAEAIVSKNKIKIYAPDYDKTNVNIRIINSDIEAFEIGPFQVYAVKTMHDGDAALRAEPHVSFVINTDEETFFIAGDAVFRHGEGEKIESLCDYWADAAFVNPFQMMMVGGNRTFLKVLDPKKVVQIHKPYPQDDTYNTYPLFDISLKKYPADMPEVIVPEFNSRIDI